MSTENISQVDGAIMDRDACFRAGTLTQLAKYWKPEYGVHELEDTIDSYDHLNYEAYHLWFDKYEFILSIMKQVPAYVKEYISYVNGGNPWFVKVIPIATDSNGDTLCYKGTEDDCCIFTITECDIEDAYSIFN